MIYRSIVFMVCLIALFTEMSTVCVQGQPDMMAIIAVRTNAVGDLGHVGVGFQNEDGTWTIGAVENTGGSPVVVGAIYDNGGWVESHVTLPEVEVKFHSLGYDGIKIIDVPGNTNPDQAYKVINDFPTRGYNIANNNCLSATIDVLTAFGVKNLPLQIAHVAPNDYYANVQGDEFSWDLNKKDYTNIMTGVPLMASNYNPYGQTTTYQTYQQPQPTPVAPVATQGSGNSVVGKWNLQNLDHAGSWIFNFNKDGTFDSIPSGYSPGTWVQTGNVVRFQSNPSWVWEGTITGNTMSCIVSHTGTYHEVGHWKGVRADE